MPEARESAIANLPDVELTTTSPNDNDEGFEVVEALQESLQGELETQEKSC